MVPVIVVVTRLVVVMMVVPVVFLFGVAMYMHVHARTGDSAGRGTLGMDVYSMYAECVDPRKRSLAVGYKLQQRGGEHVTGRAHPAVKVESFHSVRRRLAHGGVQGTTLRRTRQGPPQG